jgi:hypothetical protein
MDIMGHNFDLKTLLVTVIKGSPGILISPVIRKIILSRSKKDKHLTIETIRRVIVLEDLEDLPFSIKDEDGNPIYNCYLIQFRIWNKGKEVIRGQDISQSEPFTLEISNGARVLGSPFTYRDPDDIGLKISDLENGRFKVDFDFINSDEWLEICFYVTGNPNAKVSASGRVAGQKSPEFHVSIDDGRASLGERLISLFVILFFILQPTSLIIGCVWLLQLLYDYSLQGLFSEPDHIPENLVMLLFFGSIIPIIYIFYSVALSIERKRHPKNYQLMVDYEPKPIQSFLSYWNTFLKGKKYLSSNSSYNYGEIFVPNQEDK